MPKLDKLEVISLTDHACMLIRDALKRMPGKPGPERQEAMVIATMGCLVASAMWRYGLGDPSQNALASGALIRRLLDAIEDWETWEERRAK